VYSAGLLSCILFFSLVQTLRICLFRHNLRSFQLTFVVLCLLWTGLRVFFWINTLRLQFYAQLFLYRVPTVLEFATFSLLIIFFTAQVRFLLSPKGASSRKGATGHLGSLCAGERSIGSSASSRNSRARWNYRSAYWSAGSPGCVGTAELLGSRPHLSLDLVHVLHRMRRLTGPFGLCVRPAP
jgi:hypothetical protein